MSRLSILGVPVDRCTVASAAQIIKAWLQAPGQHQVITPNPEMIVASWKNQKFLEVLQRGDLNIPDGAGVLWAARYLGQTLPERVTGTDVMTALCQIIEVPVFLLGAFDDAAEIAARKLQAMNPKLVIAGTFAGSPRAEDEAEIIDRINASKAELLLVAYGAPAQELWISRNLSKLPTVKVAMGVGGAFDFLSGKKKRAPGWMQRLYIEWLWRLMLEPRRIKRIWNAVIVFSLLVLTRSAATHPAEPTELPHL